MDEFGMIPPAKVDDEISLQTRSSSESDSDLESDEETADGTNLTTPVATNSSKKKTPGFVNPDAFHG